LSGREVRPICFYKRPTRAYALPAWFYWSFSNQSMYVPQQKEDELAKRLVEIREEMETIVFTSCNIAIIERNLAVIDILQLYKFG
jgi:hypothetical protein